MVRKVQAEMKSNTQQKKGRLISLIDTHWKPDDARIQNLRLNKQEVMTVLYTKELSATMNDMLMTLLSTMESNATFSGLAMGLRIAFSGYQTEQNSEQLPVALASNRDF